MLLIGFAGIGFIAHRQRTRHFSGATEEMAALGGMRGISAFIAAIATAFLLLTATASATTYDYVGLPLTETVTYCFNNCPSSARPITGSVTFDFDTSQYAGTLALAPGDTAFLSNTLSGGSSYPASVTYYDPPYYGFRASLTGTFSLVNGQIVSWNLLGSNAQFGCGIGPGCEAGSSSVGSDPDSDTETSDPNGYPGTAYYYASNNGGGEWTGEFAVAAVPEPSTWAMLLIGFAGLGFVASRRSRQAFVH
jgi:hypothetical protein